MGYLVLARQQGERLYLTIRDGADEAELLEELRSGGICIEVLSLNERKVHLGLDAPRELLILREEIMEV